MEQIKQEQNILSNFNIQQIEEYLKDVKIIVSHITLNDNNLKSIFNESIKTAEHSLNEFKEDFETLTVLFNKYNSGEFKPDTSTINNISYTSFNDLYNQLKKDKVEFSYLKINGDIKKTIGTLNFDLIPDENLPKNELTMEKIIYSHLDDTCKYYDILANNWRSFKKENLIFKF